MHCLKERKKSQIAYLQQCGYKYSAQEFEEQIYYIYLRKQKQKERELNKKCDNSRVDLLLKRFMKTSSSITCLACLSNFTLRNSNVNWHLWQSN